jgi:hypothetical protein
MIRSLLTTLCVTWLFFGMATPAHAQIEETLQVGQSTCSYFGETLPETLTTFSADQEAEDIIKAIIRASGLIPNFVVRAGGVLNAAAVIRKEKRFIIYNQNFVRNLTQKTGSRWATISVMAHEIGHHLNGHTLLPGGSRQRLELEADYYSGFILQRMGAAVSDARQAIELLGLPTATATHPARHDRLAAITNGWIASCNTDPNCRRVSGNTVGYSDTGLANATHASPGRTQLAPADVIRLQTSADTLTNSCEFANDGSCDEPALCRPGTDSNDCRRKVPANALGPSLGLSAGQSLQACSCWSKSPPIFATEMRCTSGQARLSICSGSCSTGKGPYAYVCH